MPVTVSIIGTSGRKDDINRLNRDVFERMCKKTVEIVENIWKISWGDVYLVSGGAPWSDHVAVDTFLGRDTAGMTLFLPCPWISDGKNSAFQESKDLAWYANPGRILNHNHQKFYNKTGIRSMYQIEMARQVGVKLDTTHKTFLQTNTEMAKSDYVIAFGFSEDSSPRSGGTSDTWKKCKGTKTYVNIGTLVKADVQKKI